MTDASHRGPGRFNKIGIPAPSFFAARRGKRRGV